MLFFLSTPIPTAHPAFWVELYNFLNMQRDLCLWCFTSKKERARTHPSPSPPKKTFYNIKFKDEAELLEHVLLFMTNAFEHE